MLLPGFGVLGERLKQGSERAEYRTGTASATVKTNSASQLSRARVFVFEDVDNWIWCLTPEGRLLPVPI